MFQKTLRFPLTNSPPSAQRAVTRVTVYMPRGVMQAIALVIENR